MDILEAINRLSENNIELAYLWVEDCGIIKNQEFNFSSKYTFHYDILTDNISWNENEDYIEDFFGENISNITAIVGQNGSGKSFVLSNIYELIFSEEINHVTIFISNNDLIKITPKSIFRGKIDNINDVEKEHNLKNDSVSGRLEIKSIYSIFYSHVFYESIGPQAYKRPIIQSNISTTCLLSDIEAFGEKQAIKKLNQLDMICMVAFLKVGKKKIDSIIKPSIKYIKLKLIDNYSNWEERTSGFILLNDIFSNQSNLVAEEERGYVEKFEKIRNALFEFINIECQKNENLFKIVMIKNILFDLYKILENETRIQVDLGKSHEYYFMYSDETSIDDLNNMIEIIFKLIEDYYNKDKNTDIDLLNKLMELKSFLGLVNNFERLFVFEKKKHEYILSLSDSEKLNEFIYILNKYYKANQNDYFLLKWAQEIDGTERNLSSGEEVMFKMYARLYNQITHNVKITGFDVKDNLPKNILLLLDEPEAYLHPEWQRQFISKIIIFLNEFFGDYNVQIIISSNTPFLLSDLPKNNTILLEKNENGNIGVKPRKEYEETFAQNIHTLLTKSFFMDSTIGEFAKSRINYILRVLNDKEQKIEDKKTIQKMIAIVGEPLIKNRLLDMFYEKFGDEQMKIEMINKKIEELQRIKSMFENGEKIDD